MNTFAPLAPNDYKECLAQHATIAKTQLGPMQYAERGSGHAIISVHGGPGGHDQGLALGECFRKQGFKIIAPSRPGYLDTPIDTGATLEAQADALAALMDALGIEKAAVLGASAGGPSSYLLAQRHPHKVAALIEIDSVSMTYTKADELNKTEEFFYLSKPGVWLMDFFMRHFPSTMVKEFLESESSLEQHELGERVKEVVNDPLKLTFIQTMTQTMVGNYEKRKPGVENDLFQMRQLDKLPLDKVECPTLVIHGNADADVPLRDAQYAHSAIVGSELYIVDRASHIGFWISDHADEAQKYAVAWLQRHYGQEP